MANNLPALTTKQLEGVRAREVNQHTRALATAGASMTAAQVAAVGAEGLGWLAAHLQVVVEYTAAGADVRPWPLFDSERMPAVY